MKSTFFASLFLAAAMTLGFSTHQSTDVINFGRDGAICTLNGQFGFGLGRVTLVIRDGGLETFSCQGRLEDASAAPSSAYRGDVTCNASQLGQLVVTPSGRFSAVCSGNR